MAPVAALSSAAARAFIPCAAVSATRTPSMVAAGATSFSSAAAGAAGRGAAASRAFSSSSARSVGIFDRLSGMVNSQKEDKVAKKRGAFSSGGSPQCERRDRLQAARPPGHPGSLCLMST